MASPVPAAGQRVEAIVSRAADDLWFGVRIGRNTQATVGCAAHVDRTAARYPASVVAGDSAGNPPADATVFRALQECLSNIAKHAEGRRVQILLERSTCAIHLNVADDGRGFDRAAGSGVGVGLVSMRERAELAGGGLAIESTPGGGCSVVLKIPAREG